MTDEPTFEVKGRRIALRDAGLIAEDWKTGNAFVAKTDGDDVWRRIDPALVRHIYRDAPRPPLSIGFLVPERGE